MAYKVLSVDYEQMGKLAKALRDASERAIALAQQMQREVDELDDSWKGPNHDAFVEFFNDRFFWLEAYTTSIDYFGYQAEWVEQAIVLYKALEVDLNDAVKNKIKAAG